MTNHIFPFNRAGTANDNDFFLSTDVNAVYLYYRILRVLEWVDEQTLYLTTMMEGRISARNFLLSLGNQCQLVSPQDLKQEIHAIAKDMLALYS